MKITIDIPNEAANAVVTIDNKVGEFWMHLCEFMKVNAKKHQIRYDLKIDRTA